MLKLLEAFLTQGVLEEMNLWDAGSAHAPGRGDDGLNAKDNFQFERTVRYRQEGKRT